MVFPTKKSLRNQIKLYCCSNILSIFTLITFLPYAVWSGHPLTLLFHLVFLLISWASKCFRRHPTGFLKRLHAPFSFLQDKLSTRSYTTLKRFPDRTLTAVFSYYDEHLSSSIQLAKKLKLILKLILKLFYYFFPLNDYNYLFIPYPYKYNLTHILHYNFITTQFKILFLIFLIWYVKMIGEVVND